MAIFRAPGLADVDAPTSVIDAWNQAIVSEVSQRPSSPFLVLNPSQIVGGQPTVAIKWPGQPLEPANCLDEDWAERLSDWGLRGRLALHNEYLEYGFVMRPDGAGRMRPKRFIATTELMEWWQTMAAHSPEFFVARANTVAGTSFSVADLLGMSVAQWLAQSVPQRQASFRRRFVGLGASTPPQHGINLDHLLFMQHQINGLDDLIFVVHFGTFPYAVRTGTGRRRATIEEVFRSFGRDELFCRNADPAACSGAYDQVFQAGTEDAPKGSQVAFADPVGMYIRTFGTGDLFLDSQPVPKSWTILSRGAEHGMAQRLMFGPSDAEPWFLDDATVDTGPGAKKVTGYKLASRIEVGPIVVVGPPKPVPSSAFVDINALPEGTIDCGSPASGVCTFIAALKAEFDAQMNFSAGQRGGRRG